MADPRLPRCQQQPRIVRHYAGCFTQQLDYLKSKGVSVQTMQSALDETLPQVGIPVTPPVDSPPNTTITSQPPASTTSTSATVQFASNESGSTFECNLDNAGFTPCVSPVNYSILALGQHTFSVRATDTSNQTDGTPATASWTIEAAPTPPDTTITSGPSNPTTSTSASFAFSSRSRARRSSASSTAARTELVPVRRLQQS